MDERHLRHDNPQVVIVGIALAALGLASCGGGTSTGNPQDSGSTKTYLSVQANDAEGDTLQYQWRVSSGSIENRNAPQTVWTMPDGPGLHFAYVSIVDGRGGHVEQQYAVSSDALGTTTAPAAPLSWSAPLTDPTSVSAGRLRASSATDLGFAPPGGGAPVARRVYLPDVQVQLSSAAAPVFSGATDAAGELNLPFLAPGSYSVGCATVKGSPLAPCGSITVNSGSTGGVIELRPAQTMPSAVDRNLRLFGHVVLADGAACGYRSEFFGLQSAATVQLLQPDGSNLMPPVRVNRFGDYAVDAAVLANGNYKLQVSCEGFTTTLDVPAAPVGVGYASTAPVELSYRIPNTAPTIVRMVATGGDGNVRGAPVIVESGISTALPGGLRFLSYKGLDTAMSACRYYQSLGAAKDCDPQGGLVRPITLDDWKRQHRLAPFDAGGVQAQATYVNRMDLNLVRRMYATQAASNDIAFYVCNHPGPTGTTQAEVDDVIATGLADQKRVACVAMEWSASPGVNGGNPFTKFLTFGPDGALITSINLDGRGEKYMPGVCVACHGGTLYNGRFAEQPLRSPNLGAGFLPFDTGNYLYSTGTGLSKTEQSQAIHALNKLVMATDVHSATHATTNLINGWYATPGGDTLDESYVPPAWLNAAAAAGPAGADLPVLYREVVGRTCRTCHVAMGSNRFDWDANPFFLTNGTAPTFTAYEHFCGGGPDLMVNASMPNALISRDRVADRIAADPTLAAIVTKYLGCSVPLPDPAYPRH